MVLHRFRGLLLFLFKSEAHRKMKHRRSIGNYLRPVQIITMGFAGLILVGAVLLCLPFATVSGKSAGFFSALFTSTSASCVTGLIVHDTASYWSFWGQLIILLLIQIGGLGVVTMAVAIHMISGKKIGLGQRSQMQQSISAPQIQGIVKLARFIILSALAIEGIGAAALAPRLIPDYGIIKGIWFAIFHSVSAFCNAGFDLFGTVESPYVSLVGYRYDPVVNTVIMALIFIGGIGFLTWHDIRTHGFHIRRWRLQSKVSLLAAAVLLAGGFLYFFFAEFHTLPLGKRIWMALFQSVTPRTAGFNTADQDALSDAGTLVTTILMMIGGSTASTAGGIKTTTVVVMVCAAFAVFGMKKDVTVMNRRITENSIRSAGAIVFLYLTLQLLTAIIISLLEGLPILTCMYETASAIGTVGLTLGITPGLSPVSRLLLILLMYVGRVGGLTLIFAMRSPNSSGSGRFLTEDIAVG